LRPNSLLRFVIWLVWAHAEYRDVHSSEGAERFQNAQQGLRDRVVPHVS